MSASTDRDGADPVGSAADEAVKLVEALRDLVSGPGAEHLATGSAECRVCPFCRLVALLREADPQTVARTADSVVGTVAGLAAVAEPLLRSLVDTAVTSAQAASARVQDQPPADQPTTDDPKDTTE